MRTDGHYDVVRREPGDGTIRGLRCAHCPLFLHISPYRRGGDRSGQPKYNRMRAAMVRHLHERHRSELAAGRGPFE